MNSNFLVLSTLVRARFIRFLYLQLKSFNLMASPVIKNPTNCMSYRQMGGEEMANSLPCVAPAKTPPARQHVQRESLQSITSSLQSTACFVAPCPVGNLEAGPLFFEITQDTRTTKRFRTRNHVGSVEHLGILVVKN